MQSNEGGASQWKICRLPWKTLTVILDSMLISASSLRTSVLRGSLEVSPLLAGITGEQTIALDHRYAVILSCNAFPDVPRTNFSFAQHSKIKAAAAARVKPFWHVRALKSYSQFVTRHARLRHFHDCVSDAALITERD